MSLGFGVYFRLYAEDDATAIYECGEFDLNCDGYKEYYKNRLYDGLIIIKKKYLVEPEIHRKIKRMPSGRKRLVEKKIIKNIPGYIMVEDPDVETNGLGQETALIKQYMRGGFFYE